MKRSLDIRHGSCQQTTVITPRERCPGSMSRALVPEVRGVLVRLIVVDAKGSGSQRRIEDQSAVRWTEVPRSRMPEGEYCLEPVVFRRADPGGHSVDFRFAP